MPSDFFDYDLPFLISAENVMYSPLGPIAGNAKNTTPLYWIGHSKNGCTYNDTVRHKQT